MELLRAIGTMRRFGGDRRGITALEYGIIASILGLVLVTIFTSFGSALAKLFASVGAEM
jgi:pilus assembly protein Flp/PilA